MTEGVGPESPRPSLPTVVTKAYDLLQWLINHVGKYLRSHRFVLGERVETAMLDILLAKVFPVAAASYAASSWRH